MLQFITLELVSSTNGFVKKLCAVPPGQFALLWRKNVNFQVQFDLESHTSGEMANSAIGPRELFWECLNFHLTELLSWRTECLACETQMWISQN